MGDFNREQRPTRCHFRSTQAALIIVADEVSPGRKETFEGQQGHSRIHLGISNSVFFENSEDGLNLGIYTLEEQICLK